MLSCITCIVLCLNLVQVEMLIECSVKYLDESATSGYLESADFAKFDYTGGLNLRNSTSTEDLK